MEILLPDGTTARPTKQVKAMQILREQKLELESKRRVATDAEALAFKEERRARELDDNLREAQRSLAAQKAKMDASPLGYHAQPPEDIQLLKSLQSAVEFGEAQCVSQHKTAQRERAVYIHAEREVQVLERLAVKNEQVMEQVEEVARREAEQRAKRADQVIGRELDAAHSMEQRHIRRMKHLKREEEKVERKRQAQAQAAAENNRGAVKRMMETTATTLRVVEDIKAQKELDWRERVECILELKANTDNSFAKLKGANERNARRRAAQAAARQKEFKELEGKGENPYKVFRQRELHAQAVKQEKTAKEAVRRKESELVHRILREDEYQQKKDAMEDQHKAYEKAFRDELGRHVIEERNRQYLVSRTTEGVELVDPTGRSVRPFEPSQVTTIKDNSFGLGFNPRKDRHQLDGVIAMVSEKPEHAKHGKDPDLGEFKRFLPAAPPEMAAALKEAERAKHASAGDDDGVGGGSSLATELALASQRLGEFGDPVEPEVSVAALKGAPGEATAGGPSSTMKGSSSAPSTSQGGRPRRNLLENLRPLSKFELDCRRKAQEEQAARLARGTPQIAGGRTFAGKMAFVPRPAVVDFKDFDVGKTYHRRFTLTNVSLTFNSFKVMDMADNVRDFFEVSYVKPGRMSAGTSCTIDVTFKPQVNEDIFTEIPLLSQTGPCNVPITCTTKKVIPSANLDHVDFKEVVMGEVKTIHLVIKNDGALPCKYELFDPRTGLLVGNQAPFKRETGPEGSVARKKKQRAEEMERERAAAEEKAKMQENADGAEAGAEQDEAVEEKKEEEEGGAELAVARDELGFEIIDETPGGDLQHEVAIRAMEEQERQRIAEEGLIEDAEEIEGMSLQYDFYGRDGALFYDSAGEIAGYSEVRHAINFGPLEEGFYRETVALRFTDTDRVIDIEISGAATLYPIYAKESLMDLGVCLFGKLYRKKLRLCNRGKIAFKVQAEVPPEFEGCLEFGPDMGFVQPGVDFEMGLKFRPTEVLLERCREALIPGFVGPDPRSFVFDEGSVILIPIRVPVPKQAIPVFFTFRCQLTTGGLSFSSEQIDFGPCYTTERMAKTLELVNLSRLPQKFGFVKLHRALDVQPADGFGVLLPFESRQVDVIFKPESSVEHKMTLTCRTTMGYTYNIPISGQGLEPPLIINQSVLHLVPASVGDKVYESVLLTNPSKKQTRQFQWCVPYPELSHLEIAPKVATLPPGKQARVELTWHARDPPKSKAELAAEADARRAAKAEAKAKAEAEAAAQANAKGKGKKGKPTPEPTPEPDAEEGEEEEEEEVGLSADDIPEEVGYVRVSTEDQLMKALGRTDEPWSVHAHWNVPCFVRSLEGDVSPDDDEDSAPSSTLAPLPQYLSIKTCVVDRIFEADMTAIDFGELAVGETKQVPLRIRNHSSTRAPFSATGLNAVGAFSIVNALRPIKPQDSETILMQFAPDSQGVRQEILTLHSAELGRTLYIALRGEGVSPVLTINPPDGMIDLGHCLEGDESSATVMLRNDSVFPLTYTLIPEDEPVSSFIGQQPFTIIPNEAEVQPGQELEVMVIFRPDHERVWPYHQRLKVFVPNQEKTNYLSLSGRSHARQMYAVSYDSASDAASQQPEDREDPFLVSAADLLANGLDDDVGFGERPVDVPVIKLTFPREDSSVEREVTVGCIAIKNDAKFKGGGGNYELEWVNNQYFSADQEKGNCNPGEKTTIKFKFKPPEIGDTYGLDVGQWERTIVKINLNNGFSHEHASQAPVEVLLEGFISI